MRTSRTGRRQSVGRFGILTIVLIYIVVGGLWILLSDRLLLSLVDDPVVFARLQTYKGWFYVLATAWMLHALIKRNTAAIRRSEEALRVSEERFRLAVDNSPYTFAIYDPNLRYIFMNTEGLRASGYSEQEMIGRRDEELFPPETTQAYLPLLHRAAETCTAQTAEVDVTFRGHTLTLVLNYIPLLDNDGRIRQILGLYYDITERKRAEQRRLELEENQRDFYRRTILAATEGKLVISEPEEIRAISGSLIATWEVVMSEDLSTVRDGVAEAAKSAGMDDNRVYDFVLAVGEAITNACKHAGGGRASLHRRNDTLMFVIEDRGPGIEALTLPEVALVRGYSTAGTLGMGYKAILSVADKVYLATGPAGTVVGIEMKIHTPAVTVDLPDTWKS